MNIPNTAQTARVRRPERLQVQMHMHCWDELLRQDHVVRSVWSFVKSLDLQPFYAQIEVSHDTPGRPAIAPEALITLWLQATLDGIGSARELARRCETDFAYLWVLGDVKVNYHTLSDFRVQHGERLERLLVDAVAALVKSEIVPLDTIAQDGMRVRAHAGKSSFRRRVTLEQLQQAAQEHLDRLKQEAENEAQQRDARQKAAQQRAAEEQKQRIDEALRQHEELSRQRNKRKPGDGETTRVSTTDPEARVMKTANGGFDPAYNVQFATDAKTRIIVAVDVTNHGTDGGELPPMLDKIRDDYCKTPRRALVDSAFATKESVTAAELGGTAVISSVPRAEQLQEHGKDPHAAQKNDTPEYVEFRERMADPANKELYKTRPSLAEFPNAVCRNHNLRQFPVRGLLKAKCIALWHALAYNFQRFRNLKLVPTQ